MAAKPASSAQRTLAFGRKEVEGQEFKHTDKAEDQGITSSGQAVTHPNTIEAITVNSWRHGPPQSPQT